MWPVIGMTGAKHTSTTTMITGTALAGNRINARMEGEVDNEKKLLDA